MTVRKGIPRLEKHRKEPDFGTKCPEAAGKRANAGTRRYCRGPRKAAWLCGERRSSGASEFCRLRRNERYAACDDEAGNLFGENGNGKQNGGNA